MKNARFYEIFNEGDGSFIVEFYNSDRLHIGTKTYRTEAGAARATRGMAPFR